MPSDALIGVVFLGDIVGQPGREAVRHYLPAVREAHRADLVLANGENAAGGTGLTPQVADDLLDLGIDVLTTGNHVWAKKELIPDLAHRTTIVRPANYPPGAPGSGWCLADAGGTKVGVVNLCGRVFMNPLDCPFQVGLRVVEELRRVTPVIVVDMHAEATSEKVAMGYHLDGKVSAVIGTHTHVQTADARILPRGTAYLSDAGMTGPSDSVLGMRKDIILTRFLTQLPQRFEVGKGEPFLEGVALEIQASSGKAHSISTFRYGG